MSYLQKTLMPNEAVVYEEKVHPIIIYRALAAWMIPAIVLALFSQESFLGSVCVWLGVLGVVGIPIVIAAVLKIRSSECVVTNKRVVLKTGILQTHAIDLLLQKIESISVDQHILGRMLGYGTIVVHGTGGSKEPFHYLTAPFEFRNRVQLTLEDLKPRIEKRPA